VPALADVDRADVLAQTKLALETRESGQEGAKSDVKQLAAEQTIVDAHVQWNLGAASLRFDLKAVQEMVMEGREEQERQTPEFRQ